MGPVNACMMLVLAVFGMRSQNTEQSYPPAETSDDAVLAVDEPGESDALGDDEVFRGGRSGNEDARRR